MKQASRQWYPKLTQALYSIGYIHSMHDYSLFHKKTSDSTVYVAMYVDDILLTEIDLEEIKDLRQFLHQTLRIKDLSKLYYFLGMEVTYTDDGLIISQRKFFDILKEHGCLDKPSTSSPLGPSIKLRAKEGVNIQDPTT